MATSIPGLPILAVVVASGFACTAASSPQHDPPEAGAPVASQAATPGQAVASGSPSAFREKTNAACGARTGPTRPIVVSHDAFAKRVGATASEVERIAGNQAKPAQTCGRHGTAQLLANLSCPDGSPPTTTAGEAMDTLVGSAGPGGVCNNDILQYRLTCGGKAYDVFVDMYWCVDAMHFDRDPLNDY